MAQAAVKLSICNHLLGAARIDGGRNVRFTPIADIDPYPKATLMRVANVIATLLVFALLFALFFEMGVGVVLILFGVLVLSVAVDGFRTGVMFGRAADVDRIRNPKSFRFVGLLYCSVGIAALCVGAFDLLR
jgi:hypothetical protein